MQVQNVITAGFSKVRGLNEAGSYKTILFSQPSLAQKMVCIALETLVTGAVLTIAGALAGKLLPLKGIKEVGTRRIVIGVSVLFQIILSRLTLLLLRPAMFTLKLKIGLYFQRAR